MTARELIHFASDRPLVLAGAALAPPLVAWIVGLCHEKDAGGTSPWKYLYSILVYAVAFPGVAAAVLTAYALFFTNENLLDVNLLVYGLPIVSMAATLVLVRRNVRFDQVPGFDRLSGLVVTIAVTMVLVLAIRKTAIWIFFGGSIAMLVVLVAGLFGLLKWGTYVAFRPRGTPAPPPPPVLGGGSE